MFIFYFIGFKSELKKMKVIFEPDISSGYLAFE